MPEEQARRHAADFARDVQEERDRLSRELAGLSTEQNRSDAEFAAARAKLLPRVTEILAEIADLQTDAGSAGAASNSRQGMPR